MFIKQKQWYCNASKAADKWTPEHQICISFWIIVDTDIRQYKILIRIYWLMVLYILVYTLTHQFCNNPQNIVVNWLQRYVMCWGRILKSLIIHLIYIKCTKTDNFTGNIIIIYYPNHLFFWFMSSKNKQKHILHSIFCYWNICGQYRLTKWAVSVQLEFKYICVIGVHVDIPAKVSGI